MTPLYILKTTVSTEDTGPKWLLLISNQYIYFKSLSFLPLIDMVLGSLLLTPKSRGHGAFVQAPVVENMFFGYILHGLINDPKKSREGSFTVLIKWQLFPVLANIAGHKPRGAGCCFLGQYSL